jgi:signal transduction histidine kinase
VFHDLLVLERNAILTRCEEKVLRFGGALAARPPIREWTVFYDELLEQLDSPEPFAFAARLANSDEPALWPTETFKFGYSVSDVVKGYEALYQSIAERAESVNYILSPNEHTRLSLSIGTVVADAVADITQEHARVQSQLEVQCLGELAHELRNNLQSIIIGLEMMESGSIGTRSNTSESVQRSVKRMGQLIDTTLTEVRMRVEPTVQLTDLRLMEIINEISTTAQFLARTKQITLLLHGHYDLVVIVDRPLAVSALSNVLQNAIKYSREGSTVRMTAFRKARRVIIEIEDECGGLPAGAAEDMFKPFVQRSSDHSGMGLGLTISQNAIKRCGGTMTVRDKPGQGCVFTIDLPEGDKNALEHATLPRPNWP